jgi:hypothetical protein
MSKKSQTENWADKETPKEIMDIDTNSIPRQVAGFKLNKTACCYFLKETEKNTSLRLTDSSALLWQICTGEWTVGEIIDVLKESYPDAAESMEHDIYEALTILVWEDAIELETA